MHRIIPSSTRCRPPPRAFSAAADRAVRGTAGGLPQRLSMGWMRALADGPNRPPAAAFAAATPHRNRRTSHRHGQARARPSTAITKPYPANSVCRLPIGTGTVPDTLAAPSLERLPAKPFGCGRMQSITKSRSGHRGHGREGGRPSPAGPSWCRRPACWQLGRRDACTTLPAAPPPGRRERSAARGRSPPPAAQPGQGGLERRQSSHRFSCADISPPIFLAGRQGPAGSGGGRC